jgi:hypothetical protein
MMTSLKGACTVIERPARCVVADPTPNTGAARAETVRGQAWIVVAHAHLEHQVLQLGGVHPVRPDRLIATSSRASA